MELKEGIKLLEKQIKELEAANYIFENVVKPRAEADRQVLEKLKKQHFKMAALVEKAATGAEITEDEENDAVPRELR
jgi:exonuclease VII small subunit